MTINQKNPLTIEQIQEKFKEFYQIYSPEQLQTELWEMFEHSLASEILLECPDRSPANLAYLYKHLKDLFEFFEPMAA